MLKRDEYVAKLKLQLDELNVKMAELEVKAQEVKEDARERYQEEVSKLHVQSKLAISKLEELKTASEESWEGMVASAEKVRDAFVHSFHYFKSQL